MKRLDPGWSRIPKATMPVFFLHQGIFHVRSPKNLMAAPRTPVLLGFWRPRIRAYTSASWPQNPADFSCVSRCMDVSLDFSWSCVCQMGIFPCLMVIFTMFMIWSHKKQRHAMKEFHTKKMVKSMSQWHTGQAIKTCFLTGSSMSSMSFSFILFPPQKKSHQNQCENQDTRNSVGKPRDSIISFIESMFCLNSTYQQRFAPLHMGNGWLGPYNPGQTCAAVRMCSIHTPDRGWKTPEFWCGWFFHTKKNKNGESAGSFYREIRKTPMFSSIFQHGWFNFRVSYRSGSTKSHNSVNRQVIFGALRSLRSVNPSGRGIHGVNQGYHTTLAGNETSVNEKPSSEWYSMDLWSLWLKLKHRFTVRLLLVPFFFWIV